MIIVECEQRTPEWYEARLGVVTASELDRILTPVELKKSTQAAAYRYRLLAEWLTGKPHESYSEGEWMKRGTELEDEARRYYEALTDKELRQVGFVYHDDTKLVGCSPDAIEERNGKIVGGLEIKVPAPGTHVSYLLADRLPREYILQVQGQMFVTGAGTWDWLSYHPDMKPVLLTVKRDERIIDALQLALDDFLATMLRERELLAARGSVKEALVASLEVLASQ